MQLLALDFIRHGNVVLDCINILQASLLIQNFTRTNVSFQSESYYYELI